MTSLDNLIAPISADEFLERYWSKEFLFSPQGARALSGLFSWRALNRALTYQRLSYPRVRVMRAEKAVPTEEFVSRRIKFAGQEPTELLDLEAVNKLLAKGASLILNAADECDPALRSLCRSLSEVFASHVAANAYASFGNEPAFPVHWDDHEVLVIQIEGRKHWRVFEPSRPQPLGNDVESNIEPSDRQIWEGVIGPGDKLYIPRGRWHSVTLARSKSLTCPV